MSINYYEAESLILKKAKNDLGLGGDPSEIYQKAAQDIYSANKIYHGGASGAGLLVSPSRGLDNLMRSQGHADVVEQSGGPAADWGP